MPLDLREYKLHPFVRAAKVIDVKMMDDGSAVLDFEGCQPIGFELIWRRTNVSKDFVSDFKPAVGGYYVELANGDSMFCDSQIFEAAVRLFCL